LLESLFSAVGALTAGTELPDYIEDGPSGYLESMTWVYLAGRDLDRAIRSGERAAQLEASNPRVHWLLGQVFARAGWDGQSVSSFTRATVLNSSDSVLGLSRAMMMHPERAHELSQSALQDLSAWPSARCGDLAALTVSSGYVPRVTLGNSQQDRLLKVLGESVAKATLADMVAAK